jgi:beta-galactosidase GanA
MEYLKPKWQQAKGMNLNSVIASISWEQFEPVEGTYDYTLIDGIITEAEKTGMKVALIWFASWKNGHSTYAPLWVKADTKRFFRVRNRGGENTATISPACVAAREADAKAFAALMARIGQRDKGRMIVVAQVQNEMGCFSDIDYSAPSLEQFSRGVPPQLMRYLLQNEETLKAEVKEPWIKAGKRTEGTWKEVFGDNADAREFFMAWQYASYVQEAASRGKEQHNIPMYVNSWQKKDADQPAGVYPCGGPVARVMDIYKAAAPAIDICAPDIYYTTFRETCIPYVRPDNPLFIPESTRDAGKAFYVFAELNALCFAPFGIENGNKDLEFIAAYGVLRDLLPTIQQYQGTGKMRGWWRQNEEERFDFTMGQYELEVHCNKKSKGYGLVIQTGPEDFLISGIGTRIFFKPSDKNLKAEVGSVQEVRYDQGKWVPVRWLNGDEGDVNGVKVWGRGIGYGYTESQKEGDLPPAPVDGTNTIFATNSEVKWVNAPGVYQVRIYTVPKR